MPATGNSPTVVGLYAKVRKRVPMEAPPSRAFDFIRRSGIDTDVHRDPLSPRQVLLLASEDLGALGLDYSALRGNIITQGLDLASLASGATLAIGGHASVRLTHRCEVCAHLQRYLPEAVDLRSVNGRRGYLGVVERGGLVSLGDELVVTDRVYSAVPDHVLVRSLWVIARIPPGRVVPYGMLLRLVGAPKGYVRSLPRARSLAIAAGLPGHRVVSASGEPRDRQAEQALRRDGVRLYRGVVEDLARTTWRPRSLYLRRASRDLSQWPLSEDLERLAVA